MKNNILVREANKEDISAVAAVHSAAFSRQLRSVEWVTCNLAAYPRVQIFVAAEGNNILGYIQWSQKSGFRKNVVLELEQIAVSPNYQGLGIGKNLIKTSLPLVQYRLAEKSASIASIIVSTRADNTAQNLYRTTLGAEVEATISNLYSADEVFMVARNIPKT